MAKKVALIIDDESEILEISKELFESSEWTVLTAKDGGDAVNMLENHADEISTVVSDFCMPKLNGLEFLKEIRKRGFLSPVVFFSGFGKKEDVVEAMRLGAFDFLDKGFDYYTLLESAEKAHNSWELLVKQARLLSNSDDQSEVSTEISKALSRVS
jgi:two-component system response regulator FlrC